MVASRHRTTVISTHVDVIGWPEVLRRIGSWGRARESRYVCLSNVHAAVTAAFDVRFNVVVNQSDLCLSDGAPIAWMVRQLGAPQQQRLNGPDLMWRLLADENERGGRIYLYGSTPQTLERLIERIASEFPGIQVVGHHAPPFRPASVAEDDEDVERIRRSGAEFVFVGLGCPKQELWMAEHRGRVPGVMIGVGAAFDFHAGVVARAPGWMQATGLEWAFRLFQEPRRLWRRYLFTNVPFLLMGTAQWITSKFNGARPAARPPVQAIAGVEDPYQPDGSQPTAFEVSRYPT